MQLEGQARPLWPVRADQAESGRAPGSLAVGLGVTGTEWPVTGIQWPLPVGLGLAARHRQVPILRQMQGNAGVELPHKSPASFNIEERSSPRVTRLEATADSE